MSTEVFQIYSLAVFRYLNNFLHDSLILKILKIWTIHTVIVELCGDDPNPNEMFWDELDRRVMGKQPNMWFVFVYILHWAYNSMLNIS